MTDIRAIRDTLGLTQAELAGRLGLHQSTVSRFESGSLPLDERTKLALDLLLRLHVPPSIEAIPTAAAPSPSPDSSDENIPMERAA